MLFLQKFLDDIISIERAWFLRPVKASMVGPPAKGLIYKRYVHQVD
jgi:hypothetical protein